MKNRFRFYLLLLPLALLLPVMVLAAQWRGYHDGVRAQLFIGGTNTNADQLDALLREIAANHWQGLEDDTLIWQHDALDRIFHERKLSAHCTTISDYGVWRLRQAGYRARNVGMINLHPEVWDNVGDAHSILEVWHPRYAQWVVVDFLFNRMYVQTAVSFIQERTSPVMLADDLYSNPADFDEQLPDPEAEIYPRVAQIVIIEGGEGGTWWHGDPDAQSALDEFDRRHGTGAGGAPYRPDFLTWAYGRLIRLPS